MRFTGKTIAITGVGRAGQVGDLLAHAFIREGASVALIGRSGKELDERVNDLTPSGGLVIAVAADLTDMAATTAAAEQVREFASTRGGLGALIHAAGGFGSSGPTAESDERVWHDQIAINLTTAYVTARVFLPQLRATRGGGAILFFSSAAALPGGTVAGIAAYAAAKSGVLALMRAIAQEEQSRGVRSNAVAPTAIRTPQNESSMGADARFVEPKELADTALFLCSDEAGAITGQVIALG